MGLNQGNGFEVVFRFCGNHFKSVRREADARGVPPNEVWIFGEPSLPADHELAEMVNGVLVFVDPKMVHRHGEGR